ncbi:hypothetical protein [Rhodococcus wratislaviensis]|uniref:hypothetical protein n=1 Tax=Rhodococcus wratislaviensis TaxID=44752 RepID=UPI0013583C2F|nr:hypothetical protein [Rhodococcus wratislaviensis]
MSPGVHTVHKIALEEHFGATDPNIVEQSAAHFRADAWPTGTCCSTSTTPVCT